ncbi:hypothetical protein ACFLR4_00585 [Bacteroidota bacterium]
MKKHFALIILLLIISGIANQTLCNPHYLYDRGKSKIRRHSIDLRVSFLQMGNTGVSINTYGTSINVGGGGISGKLIYNYYPNNNYSFHFGIGAMAAQVEINELSEHTATVAPITMGMKYYFLDYPEEDFFRPFISGAMQIAIGSETSVEILSVGTHVESAMGAYVGFGTDLMLGSLIKFSTEMGYNLLTEFAEPIAGRKNYSGVEFSFGMGIMF